MGQDERQANLGLILIVMLVSGAGALAVIFLSGRDAGRATAPAFPPAPVVQEAAPPAAPDADAEAPAAAGSVLPGVVREPLARRPRAPQAQAPRSAASSSAPPAADPNEA
ncbi:MAG TPA: hypothetical protein VNI01_05530, partial [Elusimicrobiota bacterium]|nr:hypothetical protein [Elusimicrobiota bacterium]